MRLSPVNYNSIFHTMIQMQDEVESRKALTHDQFNQKIIHHNYKIYICAIVS